MARAVRRAAGTTLVEVLVAMAIGALLMTAAMAAFITTSRLMTWVAGRTDVASEALLALSLLGREMRSSAWESVTIVPPPQTALSFQPEDPTPATFTQFSPAPYFEIYYVEGPRLRRKTFLTNQTTRLTPPQVTAAISGLDGSVMAHNVQSMTLSVTSTGAIPAPGADVTFPDLSVARAVQITLTLSKQINATQTAEQQVSTAVAPRNHL